MMYFQLRPSIFDDQKRQVYLKQDWCRVEEISVMERAAENDDREGGDRNWKKVKHSSGVSNVVMEEENAEEKVPSFKEKLVGLEFKACKKDSRGCSVIDEAWIDYIEKLKNFFSDSKDDKHQETGNNDEKADDEDCVTIDITREEYERWCAPWRKSLIIKLLGKKMPLWGMKKSLDRLWKTSKGFKTRDLDNGFFVVSFEEEEDMNHVYQEGPWMIVDHYLLVQRWVPNFDPWNAECNRNIAAWVRIPLLPLEFFNMEALRKIGAAVGRTLKIDTITHSSERGRFARICIELNLQKRLHSSIKILGRKRIIEYESLHLICFNCGKYGHHRDQCLEEMETMEKMVKMDGSDSLRENQVRRCSAGKEAEVMVGSSNGELKLGGEDRVGESSCSQKRIRNAREGRSEDGRSQSGKEGLGVWNLVRKSMWRRYDILEKAEAVNVVSGKGDIGNRKSGKLGKSQNGSLNEKGQSLISTEKGHDVSSMGSREGSNKWRWVPVRNGRKLSSNGSGSGGMVQGVQNGPGLMNEGGPILRGNGALKENRFASLAKLMDEDVEDASVGLESELGPAMDVQGCESAKKVLEAEEINFSSTKEMEIVQDEGKSVNQFASNSERGYISSNAPEDVVP